jgi:hypothetical protein
LLFSFIVAMENVERDIWLTVNLFASFCLGLSMHNLH